MANLIKNERYYTGVDVELYDKRAKLNVSYNYLVEVSVNGRTSHESKPFVLISDAETYYDEMTAKHDPS